MALFRPAPILVFLFVMGHTPTVGAQESALQVRPGGPTPEPRLQECADCHNGKGT